MSDKPIYVRCGKVIDDIRAICREHGYGVGVAWEFGFLMWLGPVWIEIEWEEL